MRRNANVPDVPGRLVVPEDVRSPAGLEGRMPRMPIDMRMQIGRSSQFAQCPPSAPEILDDGQFTYFREIALRYLGISIADYKRSMVSRRVRARVRATGLSSFGDYCELLKGPAGAAELQPLINALTTNKTEFYRESHHFEHLKHHALQKLPWPSSKSSRRLRLWSAGCSSGEEAYSMAMTLHAECLGKDIADFQILATDIDTSVLAVAKAGLYHASSLAPLPPAYRAKFLAPSRKAPSQFSVRPEIANRVTFRHLNLHDAWPMKGKFDIIFCRNVVIYFDRPRQRQLFDRMANVMTDGGLLYCGHSESLFGVSSRFVPIGRSVYQRTR